MNKTNTEKSYERDYIDHKEAMMPTGASHTTRGQKLQATMPTRRLAVTKMLHREEKSGHFTGTA